MLISKQSLLAPTASPPPTKPIQGDDRDAPHPDALPRASQDPKFSVTVAHPLVARIQPAPAAGPQKLRRSTNAGSPLFVRIVIGRSRASRGAVRVAAIAALSHLALAACSAPKAPPELPPGATLSRDTGDFDDIDASIGYAAGRSEMALLRSFDADGPEGPRRTFELVTIKDEPVVVQVTRLDEGPEGAAQAGEGASLRIGCRIGAFGDPEREERFIEAFKRRLGDLEGVEVAPIR